MTDEKVQELAEKIEKMLEFGIVTFRFAPPRLGINAGTQIETALKEAYLAGEKAGLEEAAKIACPWCRIGTPMSIEPDLKQSCHNVGTETDLDYRVCQAIEIRKLAAR